MVNEYQVRVLPQVAANEQSLRTWLAEAYGFDVRTVTALRILRRSIDARQRTIFVNLKVRVYINEPPQDDAYQHVDYPDVSDRPAVVVVAHQRFLLRWEQRSKTKSAFASLSPSPASMYD